MSLGGASGSNQQPSYEEQIPFEFELLNSGLGTTSVLYRHSTERSTNRSRLDLIGAFIIQIIILDVNINIFN